MKKEGAAIAYIRYCAIPTRFTRCEDWPKVREKILATVRGWGDAPVIPFDLGPYEDFEGNPRIGRERTLRMDICLKNGCEADAIFGISDGVMAELKNTLDNIEATGIDRDVRICLNLDSDWENYYDQLKNKYGDLLARLRGNHTLFALVGARAIGKTFWSERLLKHFSGKMKRIKNTTTRSPRNAEDHESYQFLSKEDFEKGVREGQFLEWDSFQGNCYGSSRVEIKKVLKETHGVFAITPNGACALNDHRLELNQKLILLTPESDEVLMKNFDRRNITDPAKRAELLKDAKSYHLPDDVLHQKILITGNTEEDENNLLKIVEPLIAK